MQAATLEERYVRGLGNVKDNSMKSDDPVRLGPEGGSRLKLFYNLYIKRIYFIIEILEID
jgi:hypothetical protein